jgi:hypothetical protein
VSGLLSRDQVLDALEIVRDLADLLAPAYLVHEYGDVTERCRVCDGELDKREGDRYVLNHTERCPWRRAQEWVAETEEEE